MCDQGGEQHVTIERGWLTWNLRWFLSQAQCHCVCVRSVTQSCPTLCNPMDGSPPGSSVQGILQARKLEQVAISYSRGSSQPRSRTCISCVCCVGRRIPCHCTTREAQWLSYLKAKKLCVFSHGQAVDHSKFNCYVIQHNSVMGWIMFHSPHSYPFHSLKIPMLEVLTSNIISSEYHCIWRFGI